MKKSRVKGVFRTGIVLAIAIGVSGIFCVARGGEKDQFDAERREIELHGVRAFMKSHPYGKEFWTDFFKCVESAGCLDLARLLWSHTDGAQAEELTVSVGRAIGRNPVAVIRLLEDYSHESWSRGGVDVYDDVCAATFESDLKEELREMRRRLSALKKGHSKRESWQKCSKVIAKRISDLELEVKGNAKEKVKH